MKHTALYLILLTCGLALLSACTMEELIAPEEVTDDNDYLVGEFVDAHLSVSVGGLYVGEVSTRSEVPDLDDPEYDTEQERRVDDIWVFQYDASSGSLVNGTTTVSGVTYAGQHMTITDQSVLNNLPTLTLLTTNNNNESIVYVVTNVGSDYWITSSDASTLEKLMAAVIPNPQPIFANTAGDWTIPMSGQTLKNVVVAEDARISVPVYRMFAKLMIGVSLEGLESSGYTYSLTDLEVVHVPSTCQVSTIYDSSAEQSEGTFPDETLFLPWAYDVSDVNVTEGDTYPYVIYVPENIQGEVPDNQESAYKTDVAPDYAMKLSTYLDVTGTDGTVFSPSAYYTACPGGNNYNNYNVRRNCVYRILMDINTEGIIPSANCLVATAGTTIAFYPYYRDETGHRDDGSGGEMTDYSEYYDFENHLYPYTEGDGYYDDEKNYAGKQIKSVGIIWQEEGVIGNNSGYNLVTLVDSKDGDPMKTQIKVKCQAEGNALIGAYDGENCTGDIIWSWHIWVNSKRPDNLGNAIEYWHYDWNTDGIDTSKRIMGYPVMQCNLGAHDYEPAIASGSNYATNAAVYETYGMIYQWGRKDPFPPTRTGRPNSDPVTYDEDSGVIVYNNSNSQIIMKGNTGAYNATSGNDVFNTVLTSTLDQSSPTGGIRYSIGHPTTFIAGTKDGVVLYDSTQSYNQIDNYDNQGDWLPVGDGDLWGGDAPSSMEYHVYTIENGGFVANLTDNYADFKTIFDPCPYGWRVSPGDLWLGFTIDGKNFENSGTETINTGMVDSLNCAWDALQVANNKGFKMYMQGWHDGGVTSYFPLQGTRYPDGQPFRDGTCGNYYNATVDETVSVLVRTGTYEGVVNKDKGTEERTDAIRRVDILHFHKKGGEESAIQCSPFEYQPMYMCRATACPVRCVRDTER